MKKVYFIILMLVVAGAVSAVIINKQVDAQSLRDLKNFIRVEGEKPVFIEDPSYLCGAQRNPLEIEAAERDFVSRKAGKSGLENQSNGVIDVYFHVVNQGQGVENGDVPDAQIYEQIQVLNSAFAPSGFVFNLVSVDRTTNATWFNSCAKKNIGNQMRSALRIGSARDLNIYTCKTGGPMLGFASFPWEYRNGSSVDGVVVLHSSLPGGNVANFNLGITAVHETGHWMGLYHTFEGACTNRGDSVADTPAQRFSSYGCPVGNDTCPNVPGLDPVENYMDNSFDSCKFQFTPGQIQRMNEQFAIYRLNK